MTISVLPSLVGLLVQATGALLIATLCLVLQNTVRREPLGYWSAGWFSLSFALVSLFLSLYLSIPFLQRIAQALYIFGEYFFAYMIIIGCRRYITGDGPRRIEAVLIAPGVLLAALLPSLGGGVFNVFFAVHAVICACLFLLAFVVMWQVRPPHGSLTGLRVMKVALLLLTAEYAHYAPLVVASSYGFVPSTLVYLEYSPLYDLLLLVLLAFGMVMVMTGEVQHELEMANASLAQTRDRLEMMAQLDHLTSALNRHAFYSIIEDPRRGERVSRPGCAVIADIDSLKVVNDRYGHNAGDAAIRAIAGAIRSCIRADDLLFRWGGDEFLILLVGVSESEARARLEGLNQSLRRTPIAGVPEPVDLSVSVGYAPFNSATSLDDVIVLADSAMYAKKGRPRT